MTFTVTDLVAQFDPATYARGEAYASKGKVKRVQYANGGLEGEVEGSGGATYQQRIRIKADGGRSTIDGRCACPVARNCKHVVATLLFSLKQEQAALAGGVPAHAEQWMTQLSGAVQLAASQTPLSPLFQPLYVLIPDPDEGRLNLHLRRARLRKDGSLYGAVSGISPFELLASPERVTADQEECLRLYAALRSGAYHTTGATAPAGRTGARLLALACAQECLHYAARDTQLKTEALHAITMGPARAASLGWYADPHGATLRLGWRFADGSPVQHVLPTDPPHYLSNGKLGDIDLGTMAPSLPLTGLLQLIAQAPPVSATQGAAVARRMLEQGLDALLPLPQAVRTRRRDDIAPIPHLLLDSQPGPAPAPHWRGAAAGPPVRSDYAQLSFDYGGVRTAPGGQAMLQRVVGETVELIERDLAAERVAAELMKELGFTPPAAGSALAALPGCMQLHVFEGWERFASHGVPLLEELGWRLETGRDYRYTIIEANDWYAELPEQEEGNQWFALELGVLIDGERHSLLPLLMECLHRLPDQLAFGDAATEQKGVDLVVSLPDGRRVRLPWQRFAPLLAALREMHFKEEAGTGWYFPRTSAARLAELERAAHMQWTGGERLRALGRALHDFTGVAQASIPHGLQASLRPYQHAGLSWMQFLREHGFGGILADDMGLGKTVQTLAHILAEKEAGRLDRPALVVVPTSLMGNWQTEAARFAPGLRVLPLHGKERSLHFGLIGAADLVLTTYALLGRDEAALRGHRYHLIILDEAQYIKNSRAKAAQTARLLETRHRLCLTGTPVQNHLGELWSQFHFLMPGLLGDLKTFNAGLRRPIEQHGDGGRQALLNARVRPFMLRRTKDKVATELPPKTEIVLPVELEAAQRDLYETVRLAMDRKVREEIDRRGLARSHIVILDALLKLRQVCCDPRLLKKPASAAPSAKLATLLELMDTLRSEGRKVLVFSQFTSMLALIGQALTARGIDYALLTGDTTDRAAPIAAFQGGAVDVFLISLKAGGVGLNLTAADTVIHYDPWWNPASEHQATDRAWRIGQTQPVFVYKLIAQGTVEEKIQAMQKRKGNLANAVLDGEGGLDKGLNAGDLQAMFAPLPNN